jgi:hypothetical protein
MPGLHGACRMGRQREAEARSDAHLARLWTPTTAAAAGLSSAQPEGAPRGAVFALGRPH